MQRALPLQRSATPLLGALLLLTLLLAVGRGALSVSPGATLSALASPLGLELPWALEAHERAVLTTLRLPRALLGALVGLGLAVSGALMQGLFRNPLADPGLLGVSGGGALGAALAIVLGAGLGLPAVAHALLLPAAAFLGALLACATVWGISHARGAASVSAMLLAGVAINAITFAGTGLLTVVADDAQLRSLTWWSFGSLGGATWGTLALLAPLLLACAALALPLARGLDALSLGEREAAHLGVDVNKLRRRLWLLVAVMVGASVSATGMIGFIGLIVPHLVRLALGPGHRLLLPAAGLAGATLLVLADLIARTAAAPVELPVGVLMSLIGGPFFLGLLMRLGGGEHD